MSEDGAADTRPTAADLSTPGRRVPLRASHVLAVVAALSVLAVARTGLLEFATALAGCVVLVAGIVLGRRGGVVLGGTALFAASVLVAAASAPVLAVLVGAFGAVLAADFGTFALGLDRDVDPSVATTRVELLHAVGSTAVAALAAGVGYVTFVAAPAGSGLSVVALLGAAVVFAVLLRT